MRNKRAIDFLFMILFAAFASQAQKAEFFYSQPEFYHPLSEIVLPENPFADETPAILEYDSDLFADKEIIDFENRQVLFRREDTLGVVVWQYRYDELNEYLESRRRFVLADLWYQEKSTPKAGSGTAGVSDFALEFKLPVNYPSWAKRILGKEPPKLTIHGYEEIIISYEYRDSDKEGLSDYKQSHGGINFDNQYSLSVTGSVGRLINVQLKTSSEEQFSMDDPLKDIKIEYKGEGDELEDEIIQEVTAGYTNFEIPRTNLSGYSEGHEGLFGISVKSKLGPLDLTTVISHEQGEALKKTFYPSESKGQVEPQRDKEFLKYKIFFLDTVYQKLYNEKYGAGGNPDLAIPKVIPTEFQVWKMTEKQTVANKDISKFRYVQNSPADNLFQKIDEGAYELKEDEGWIRFDTLAVESDDIIGIYMKTAAPDLIPQKGDTTLLDSLGRGKYEIMKSLWFLKGPLNTEDTTSDAFKLMWKNAYYLPRFEEGKFDVKLGLLRAGDTLYQDPETNELYSYILGLTDKDGKRDNAAYKYNLDKGYMVIPPFDTSYEANEPFRNPELGEDTLPDIYRINHNSQNFNKIQQKYVLILSGKSTERRTKFNLAWGVIEGSEKVKGDGQELKKNVDYRIFYEMGELELISPTAQSKNKIEVQYQREALFVPEKKTFMGARGELKMPFISDKSFIGASILYQMASSREEIPRIGQEPFNKLLLDINSVMDFEPEWMTKAVNALPFISTDARSVVNIDFEVAHSRMSPSADKEDQGQAYVDNFESSKRVYPLGTSHKAWHRSSPPIPNDSLWYRPPAWYYYWYSPVDVQKEKRINVFDMVDIGVSEEDFKDQGGDLYEPVLRLECYPVGNDNQTPAVNLSDRYQNPWAGIMTSFPKSSMDRSEDRYLEFIVKVESDVSEKGNLYIDMGEVSEDLSIHGGPPNGVRNDEDPFGEGIEDSLHNTGLDTIVDNKKEYWVIPDPSSPGEWDTLRFGSDSLPARRKTDPSGDDYKVFDAQNPDRYQYANGLQNNLWLESEDINSDGFSKDESFFRYAIDLDNIEHSEFNDTTANVKNENGFYYIRIPLNENFAVDEVGNPGWEQIPFVRMWWSDFGPKGMTKKQSLVLARIQFVGNQWEEMYTKKVIPEEKYDPVQTDPTQPELPTPQKIVIEDTIKIEASVVNTEEDRGYYMPAGTRLVNNRYEVKTTKYVKLKVDNQTDKLRKEQALSLNFFNLLQGEEALVRRLYTYHTQDISAYKKISMLVHGDARVAEHNRTSNTDSLYFVFRFGTHDSSYYEYRTLIDSGWNVPEREYLNIPDPWRYPIEIDLSALANAKLAYQNAYGDTAHIDTTWAIDERSFYRISSVTNEPPSFSNIRTFMIGVARSPVANPSPYDTLSGEIWVDEMKALGLQGLYGSAALAHIHTQWADFMTLDAGANYQDGNFRTMTDNMITPGNSSVSGNVNASMKLDKFLPNEWRVSLPVDAGITGTIERPQIKPNSDISLVENDQPDKLRDFFDEDKTKSQHFQTVKNTQSVSTSYRKSATSKNILTKMTAERISVDRLSYQYDNSHRHLGPRMDGNGDYLEINENENYYGGLKYDLSPRNPPKWTKWKPFDKVKNTTFKTLKNYELTFLPSSINFDLASAKYGKHLQENHRLGTYNKNQTFDLGHGFNLSFAPIRPLLDFDYTVSIDRNLDNAVEEEGLGRDFLKNKVMELDSAWRDFYILYGEESRTQKATVRLKPKIFSWLDHNATYSAAFTGSENFRPNDPTPYLNLGVNSNLGFTGTFRLRDLMTDFSNIASKAQSMNAVFKSAEEALRNIDFNTINFNYNSSLSLLNKNMDADFMGRTLTDNGLDFLKYQLGLKGRDFGDIVRGGMNDYLDFGGMQYRRKNNDNEELLRNDSRDVRRDWSASTSFSIPSPVDFRFDRISLDHEKSYHLTPDTTHRETTVIFPKVGVSASSSFLNQIAAVKNNMRNVTMRSSYTYQKDQTFNVQLRQDSLNQFVMVTDTTTGISHSFNPLVSIKGNLKKWPINFTYEHKLKRNRDIAESGKESNSKEDGDTWTVNYAINKTARRTEFKFLRWTIPLKGRIELGLTASHSYNYAETKENQNANAQKSTDLREIRVGPHVSYGFTDKITGGTSYDFLWTDDKMASETYKEHNFSLSVKISF
ncbi:MAG: cell surface protein SprA [Chitinivibrionales bacterium]|nr:cell surface protein SprA [Chitinivibrionales bacterium]